MRHQRAIQQQIIRTQQNEMALNNAFLEMFSLRQEPGNGIKQNLGKEGDNTSRNTNS
jgi:hypothetical protein